MRTFRRGLPAGGKLARAAITLFWLTVSGVAFASPADICLRAAAAAAERSGVPYDVLVAIALTETGRAEGGRLRPWPWAVNMQGTGRWFPDRAEAIAFAHRHHRAGARNFDIGCFQLNYRWHRENFASLEEMFEPRANAFYAASFLRRLHAETGDWSAAAGAYHSRTPHHAARYRTRFGEMRTIARNMDAVRPARTVDVGQSLPAGPLRPPLLRTARPLFDTRSGAGAAMGSLVPLAGG